MKVTHAIHENEKKKKIFIIFDFVSIRLLHVNPYRKLYMKLLLSIYIKNVQLHQALKL